MIHLGHPRPLPGGVSAATGGIDLLHPWLRKVSAMFIVQWVSVFPIPTLRLIFYFFKDFFFGCGLFLKSLLICYNIVSVLGCCFFF